MMEERTVQQWQGAAELLRDGVQGAARSIEAAHLELAEIPYRVLRHVPVARGPAAAAGRIQKDITRLAYWSVGAAAGVVTSGVIVALQFHHAPRAR